MITFFFQVKEIGGVQVLIYNLIKELYENNIITKLIYFKDSWLSEELEKNDIITKFFDIEIIEFNKLCDIIEHDDILITTLLQNEYFFLKKTNPRLLFWNVFPTSLKIEKSKSDFIRKYFRKGLIKKMVEMNGLVFMDNSGVEFVKNEFNLIFKPIILQIPVKNNDENTYLTFKKSRPNEVINISYLGRAIQWKVTPVNKIIKDIIEWIPGNKEVVLHIITDEIEDFKKLIDCTNLNFEIKFYSGISGNNLRKFILDTSDIHFAMGTSCIEGSILGVPSILLDASFAEFPDNYLYRWVYENENFSLGDLLGEIPYIARGHPLSEILSYFNENKENEILTLSNNCYNYTRNNHDLKTIANSFLEICFNSKLRVNNILKKDIFYLNKTLFRKILHLHS